MKKSDIFRTDLTFQYSKSAIARFWFRFMPSIRVKSNCVYEIVRFLPTLRVSCRANHWVAFFFLFFFLFLRNNVANKSRKRISGFDFRIVYIPANRWKIGECSPDSSEMKIELCWNNWRYYTGPVSPASAFGAQATSRVCISVFQYELKNERSVFV